MTWRIPTLADRTPDRAPARVRCGCGRLEWSDDMVDLTALPKGLRPRGDGTVCGSCWQMMDQKHERRHDLLRALGAPADVVRHHADKAAGRFPPRASDRGRG